jgi:hypothetical protein
VRRLVPGPRGRGIVEEAFELARQLTVLRSPCVSAPHIELYPRTPWGLRLFDRVPLPAFCVGVAIGAVAFALFLLYTTLFCETTGRLDAVPFQTGWAAEAIQDLFLGFTLSISAASVRVTIRDFEALRPVLRGSPPDLEMLRREILTFRPIPLAITGIGLGLFSAFVTLVTPEMWTGGRFPGWTHPSVIWLAARNFLNWWVVGRAMLLELMLGHRFSRLGDHLASLDLLDRAPLVPFGRRALRNVSFWMLLAAFLSLSYAGKGWATRAMPLALVSLAGFAVAAFLLPLLGAHRRLRERKAAELARVRAAIADARDRLLAPEAAEQLGGGRLADLVAYEGRVAAVAEWPLDTSTLVRLVFYLTLGLGSWVGAALVEWLVDAVLRR